MKIGIIALIKAGATYYSDEYAVLDTNGLVYPFPSHLLIRPENNYLRLEPLSVRLVVYTQYQQGKQWQPIKMSMGEAGQILLDNTVDEHLLPFALPILSKVVLEAVLPKSFSGDADKTAKLLLQQLQ